MRGIKIYLIIVTLLLVGALGFGVYIWSKLQALQSFDATQSVDTQSERTLLNADRSINEPEAEIEAIEIKKADLTPAQQVTLETLGFKTDTLVITEGMIVCSRETLGESRYEEIIAGDTPGPIETIKLLGCIK